MSQVPIACRRILFLSTYFLLLTCLAQTATGQVKFTNLKEKYTELKVEPVLVNEGSQPISVSTVDGIVEVSILYLDKRTGQWLGWPALGMCGNITGGVKMIPPGGSEPLPLFWGMQAAIFDVKPPPRTEYKLMLYYALEPADAGGKPQARTVESAPFRLELSKRKKRAIARSLPKVFANRRARGVDPVVANSAED